MYYTFKSWLLAGALILSVTSCATFNATPPSPINVDPLLKNLPAQSAQAHNAFCDAIFDQGYGAVEAICDKLVPDGSGDDTQARFALSGLAKYAHRPHARHDRKVFTKAIIISLEEASDTGVKSFLIRQLQVAGKNDAVETLSDYLTDDALCSPATQALQAIDTRKAIEAIHTGAYSATTNTQRINLIKALAEIEHAPAQPMFILFADHANHDVRFVALLGLANLSKSNSEAILKAATQSGSDYDKIEAKALYGLYTRNRMKR